MKTVFGFDIGSNSIGWAVVDFAEDGTPKIKDAGSRIFSDSRLEKTGLPTNQIRREKRLMRRQTRRRKARRKALNLALFEQDLLPAYYSQEWVEVMRLEPYSLRKKALEEKLENYALGRAIYHLSMKRHFRSDEEKADLEEKKTKDTEKEENQKKEKKTKATEKEEENIQNRLKKGEFLGAIMAAKGFHEKKRGFRFKRNDVEKEFDEIQKIQAKHHPTVNFAKIRKIIFDQKPIFWRTNTLGTCPFFPEEKVAPKYFWLSQERVMLDTVNRLRIVGFENRQELHNQIRQVVLKKLRFQKNMAFESAKTEIKKHLADLLEKEGIYEGFLNFNLENSVDKKLPGNSVNEALMEYLKDVLRPEDWTEQRLEQIGRALEQIQTAGSVDIGPKEKPHRINLLSSEEKRVRRIKAAREVVQKLQLAQDKVAEEKIVEALANKIPFSSKRDRFSAKAIIELLPKLREGFMLGYLLESSDKEIAEWRKKTFPHFRNQTPQENLKFITAPSSKKAKNDAAEAQRVEREALRMRSLRNPTVVRVLNELRKVTNNLIRTYGKPDSINLEVTREVSLTKKKKDVLKTQQKRNKELRDQAKNALKERNQPVTELNIKKWLLWKETGCVSLYTGEEISFHELFERNLYQIDHIWPRKRSGGLNDMSNLTLAPAQVNLKKGDKIPYEYFKNAPEEWHQFLKRVEKAGGQKFKKKSKRTGNEEPAKKEERAGEKISKTKIARLVAKVIPEEFVGRQLVDTSYAAKEMKKSFSTLFPANQERVFSLPGRITSEVSKSLGLYKILEGGGEFKSRNDHRHHALDAIVVATIGIHSEELRETLRKFWQEDSLDFTKLIAADKTKFWREAKEQVDQIIVSYKVQRKASGAEHEETIYGKPISINDKKFMGYPKRISLEDLKQKDVDSIRDEGIKKLVNDYFVSNKSLPKKGIAFPSGEVLIKKVRILTKKQPKLMHPAHKGYAELGNTTHHMAVYRDAAGKVPFDVVKLIKVKERMQKGLPIVDKDRPKFGAFQFSLASREFIFVPPPGQKLTSLSRKDLLAIDEKNINQGLWLVNHLESEGPVSLTRPHIRLKKGERAHRVTIGVLVKAGAVKLSIDPIGRARLARD